MKTTILSFVLSVLPLVLSAAPAVEVSPARAESFRNHLKNSKHAVLVCEVQLTLEEPPKPSGYYKVHVSATVVQPIKGNGQTGDRLCYYILSEEKPHDALVPGGLSYLFLGEYTRDEFFLDTGDSWGYQSELEALLSQEPKRPKTK